MAEMFPQHRMRMAQPVGEPVVCDSCGAEGLMKGSELPDGWREVPMPACEWPYGEYRECVSCVAESGARSRPIGESV